MHRRVPFNVVLAMFVLSGGTALVDQLCFSKYLATIVGSTAHAVSAVLAAFMTGLALGAQLGGWLSRRITRPLLAYGVLELVVAGAVVLTPLAFAGLGPLYLGLVRALPESVGALTAARWLLAMLLVVAPTMAMGATLPFLSSGLGANSSWRGRLASDRERLLGRLYAANTLGGALGALGAAYWIVPALGLSGTLWASAAVSGCLGLVSIGLSRSCESPSQPHSQGQAAGFVRDRTSETSSTVPAALAQQEPTRELPERELMLLALLALGSGGLVFSAEVIFTHLLALIIGNSVYAFGLILAIFLLCLFLGASAVERARRRWGERALPVGLAATALALAATLPLWQYLPLLFNGTGGFITSFAARETTRALAALSILLVPTTLMGLTFPLLLARVASAPGVGALVGRLTAINTLGAVIGSITAGYLLLPGFGSERSVLLVGGCFAAMGLAAALTLREGVRATGLLVGLSVLAAAGLPRWDLTQITAGSNVYFDGAQNSDSLLFLREDVQGGVTSVSEADGVRTLYTNGKFQGNDGWEMNAQRYFAHYPSLFVPRFESALVIGLGTGTTTGTLAAYPWRHLEVAEISSAIAHAAEVYFSEVNDGALADPRVNLVFADGRNHLLLNEQRYDLVSIELSSIWFAGASSLYSSEFYELVARRLSEGGVLQQWVQLHHITTRDFATILSTMRQHFQHMALYYGGGQGIVVASERPLVASWERAEQLQKRERIRRILPEVRDASGRVTRRELTSLVRDALLVDQDLDRFLLHVAQEAGEPVDALVSTDDNLYLEYATPRGNVLPWSTRDDLVRRLQSFRSTERIETLVGP